MLQPYFGVPLSSVVRREGKSVPSLVTKIVSFILEHGLDQVGIFRINGNIKVVERLRTAFDRNGDANFSDSVDVMALAGLLKLFLRELPETLIPECFTQNFVAAQEASIKDPDGYVTEIRHLLSDLPDCNYAVLKYLSAFLVLVTQNEDVNKMNANALATIFGPNMFRCMSGLTGLKEQGITNCVTLQFITNYDKLFLEKGEPSPRCDGFQMSDLVLSKPSHTVRQESQSASKLSFQRADEPNNVLTADGKLPTNDQTSLDVQQSGKSDVTNRIASSPAISIIQDAINQAILEYVFGETVECCQEIEANLDESYNSWSLSDDEDNDGNRVAVDDSHHKHATATAAQQTATATTVDSDSVSGSDTSGDDDSDDDNVLKQKRSRSAIKSQISNDRHSHAKEWSHDSEVKFRRPVSGSISEMKKDVEPASAYKTRATSAPNSRPSSIGAKENQTQLESGAAAVRPTKDTSNSAAGGYAKHGLQGAPKSPLVEKQAWMLPVDSEHHEGKATSNSHNHHDHRHLKESGTSAREETALAEFKRLRKHIHVCKRKIRDFEDEFESTHGYKPMHSDKVANKEVRRCLEEIPESRRLLSELGDVMEALQEEKKGEHVKSGGQVKKTTTRLKIEETLATLMTKLAEKRRSASRPDDITEMTREEICEEKVCVQKALLHFETLHGRPSTPGEKELMHPLYDRYRQIKRILASKQHFDEVDDIQSASGNLSFISSLTQNTVPGSKGTSLHSGRNSGNLHASSKSQTSSSVYSIGRSDAWDRHRETVSRRKTESSGTRAAIGRTLDDDENLNLNQLSLPRLLSELQKTKAEKKHLQLTLHNFEEQFQREHGRKIQKYDQLHMDREYKQYKTIKAKLKLLEVLLAKHQLSN